MRYEGRILKYLIHVFLVGTILRKCALVENAESGKCDVKTGLSIDNWQLIIDSGQLSPCRHIPHAARQLSIVNFQLSIVLCRPYIRRLMGSYLCRRAIVNCPLSIVNWVVAGPFPASFRRKCAAFLLFPKNNTYLCTSNVTQGDLNHGIHPNYRHLRHHRLCGRT